MSTVKHYKYDCYNDDGDLIDTFYGNTQEEVEKKILDEEIHELYTKGCAKIVVSEVIGVKQIGFFLGTLGEQDDK